MTVATVANRQTFAGDGSAGPFNVTAFGIFTASDAKVTVKDDTTGVPTAKVLDTDYTVTLTTPDAEDLPSLFTINWLTTNPAVGETIIVDLFIPLTQLIDYVRRGKFPALSHEQGLDRAMLAIQQIAGPLGLTTYSVENTKFLALSPTNLDEWDAQTQIISNGKDPEASKDLATKDYVDGAVAAGGNMPPSTAVNDILVGNATTFLVKTAAQFVALFAGNGLKENSGLFDIDLGTNPGLELSAAKLLVKLGANPGLELTAAGLLVKLGANPGLELTAAGLLVKLASSSLTLGAGGLDLAAATEILKGGLEIATAAEMETATADDKIVTPLKQNRHPGSCKAWAKVGSGGTIADSFNVTSVVRNGVGDYTITIATDFSDADYVIVVGPDEETTRQRVAIAHTQAAGTFDVHTGNPATDVASDEPFWFACFGDQ